MGNILIATDIVPTKTNMELFEKGDVETLLGKKLAQIFCSADYSVINLEAPFYENEHPIDKCGPNIAVPVSAIAAFKEMRLKFCGLANNHVMDMGKEGLQTTLKLLRTAGISCTGAGFSAEEAREAFYFEGSGKKIGIYCCAEHEFSIWNKNTGAGANPIDLLESMEHIKEMKQQCDYAVVLYHGGKEHYPYPSPQQQKLCRKMAEYGADLVLCQHSHCIGCAEEYGGSTIVYGQGNLLFDIDREMPEGWNTGLVVQLEVGEKVEISYLPVKRIGIRAVLAEEEEGAAILRGFAKRSEEIRNTDFIETQYRSFAEKQIAFYLLNARAETKLFRVLNRLTKGKLVKRRFRKKQLLRLKDYILCEAHRELFLEGIEAQLDRTGGNGKDGK